MTLQILHASSEHAQQLAPLFDSYRAFFTGKSDIEESYAFLKERFAHQDSVVFVALNDGIMCGFAQIYPLLSSWYARRIWFLSDLYVEPEARGHGTASRLIERVKAHAAQTKSASVLVELPKAEPHLYRFYEHLGFHQDTVFDIARYELK